MVMRYVSLCFLSICLMGCAHFHHAPVHPVSPKVPKNPHVLSNYRSVNITGQLNVRLHTGTRRSDIVLHGDPRDTALVAWTVKDQVMRIDLPKGYPKFGSVEVELSTPYLDSVLYRGRGQIVGHGLHARRLDLSINNEGPTNLDGQLNLHHVLLAGSGKVILHGGQSRDMELILKDNVRVQIDGVSNLKMVKMSGHTWLSAYWVKSSTLLLRARDKACVQIAGTVQVLDSELKGHAHFNGRYLRANEAFVKTYDDAIADIAVVSTQHTLASDSSTINYFELPHDETNFMAFNGSVLDVHAWEQL